MTLARMDEKYEEVYREEYMKWNEHFLTLGYSKQSAHIKALNTAQINANESINISNYVGVSC